MSTIAPHNSVLPKSKGVFGKHDYKVVFANPKLKMKARLEAWSQGKLFAGARQKIEDHGKQADNLFVYLCDRFGDEKGDLLFKAITRGKAAKIARNVKAAHVALDGNDFRTDPDRKIIDDAARLTNQKWAFDEKDGFVQTIDRERAEWSKTHKKAPAEVKEAAVQLISYGVMMEKALADLRKPRMEALADMYKAMAKAEREQNPEEVESIKAEIVSVEATIESEKSLVRELFWPGSGDSKACKRLQMEAPTLLSRYVLYYVEGDAPLNLKVLQRELNQDKCKCLELAVNTSLGGSLTDDEIREVAEMVREKRADSCDSPKVEIGSPRGRVRPQVSLSLEK
jgi:hypothetical protein